MTRKMFFILVLFQYLGVCFVIAQDVATNVEIQNKDINISASGDIKLSTGPSGKVYYNNKEIAVKEEDRRSATIVIAASNASERSKEGADYVCTGENDHLIIQKALDELREIGGSITFSEGTFYFQSQVIPSGRIKMSGQGSATVFTGKNPFNNAHYGMVLCGDDLDIKISDIHFVGDNSGLKAISYLYGPLWGTTDSLMIGKNVKNIRLENLSFTSVKEKAICLTGSIPVDNVILDGLRFESVTNINFDNIKNFISNNLIMGSTIMSLGKDIQNAVLKNIFTDSDIKIYKTAIVNSSVCRRIWLTNTSNNCIIYANKTSEGIDNLGTNNHLFNNY